MTPRERFLKTMLFGKPDRIPLSPGGGRRSTLKVWHSQGLPQNVSNIAEYAYRLAGGKYEWPHGGPAFHVNERMIPQFEEKVLERKKDTQIVQDWKGNICEISNEYTTEYLRHAIDFVTRRWIKCPVESRSDWEDMKRRYDPEDPSRLPKNADELSRILKDRDWVVSINFPGPFWQVREWVGFERLCTLFYDEPEFLKEMIYFWQEYIARLLEKTFQYVIPDMIQISEDMAFKGHSMISPKMVREFLLPTYKRWGEIILGNGCPIYSVDSDGYIGELIPIWMEAGINACFPVEVAAGNDIVEYRNRFGERMAFRGGIDKRAIAKGGRVIEEEIKRLEPVIRSGGYIPGCDHAVPPDVSWPNFVYYVKLLAKATGWL